MSGMTGWQIVVEALKAEKVKYLFGLPGSALDLYDALYDAPEIQPIMVRHEAAGGFMAMAYSLLTTEPTVCFATQGPGVTNLASAMLEAKATCAPVIAICPAADGRLEGKGLFVFRISKKSPGLSGGRSRLRPTGNPARFTSSFLWKLAGVSVKPQLIFLPTVLFVLRQIWRGLLRLHFYWGNPNAH